MAGTGRSYGVLGRRWSYGGGAGVARRELRAVMATAELRELGGCCCEEERPRQCENGVRLSAGGRWRDEGAPRRVVAYVDTRRSRSGAGRPPIGLIQFVSRDTPSLTTSFDTPLTANP